MTDVAAERLLEHAHALRSLARRLVGPDADDIVQDTFADALRAPPDPARPAAPWLARALRNRAKMRFRGNARRARREQVVAVEPVTVSNPEHLTQRIETHRLLCEVIATLAEPYRTTLVAHYYDGLTLADIARQMRVNEATMRSRHKEALARVRAGLDERSGGDRRAWVAGLAPLVGPRPVAGQAAHWIGGIAVKKIVVTMLIALIALVFYLKLRADDPAAAKQPARSAVRIAFGAQLTQPAHIVGADPDGATAWLAPDGARITGSVVDEIAHPVANANIWVFDGTHPATRAAVSDDAGRFLLAGLPAGRFELLATAGELVAQPKPVSLAYGASLTIQLVVRAPRVQLTGRVIDEAGRGLGGATVEVTGMLSRTTHTDGGGQFRIGGLVAGLYDVAALAEGHVRAHASKLVPHDGEVDVTLRAPGGITVVGIVRTAAGTPVADALVASSAWNLDDKRLEVETDARGQFRLGPLPVGSVRLSAFHPSHGVSEAQTIALPAGAAPSTELVFRSSAGVEGLVVTDDGTPAAGAAITITADDAPARWSLDADARGRFSLSSLPEGSYTIGAAAHPDVPVQRAGGATTSVNLRAGARERIELKIAGGSERVVGRVIDDHGAPVAGAAVWAESAGRTMSSTPAEDIDAYSRADGTFALEGLSRGAYDIYAALPGRASGKVAGVPAGQTGITVQLAPGARVEGRAIGVDGKPIRSFRVEWKWISRSTHDGEVVSRASRMIEDADGRFVIEGLEPTRMFMLTIETADAATGDARPFALAAGERKTGIEIAIERVGHVRGRLIDRATGKPAIGLVVFFPAIAAREQVAVDGEGRFEAQVPAGSYQSFNIQSETQGYPSVKRAFTVAASQTSDLGDVLVDLK